MSGQPAGGGRLPERLDVVRSSRVVFPDGVRPAAVHLAGGRIVAITDFDDVPTGAGSGAGAGAGSTATATGAVTDLGELALMPGGVDSHVHVNEPGRAEWEGFATATRAAAAGGVTTIVDMPLNAIPPTTSVAALAEKRAAAAGNVAVDVGFWGGIVGADARRVADLAALHDAGVFGFKAFLAPSGVAEFPHVTMEVLAAAARHTARLGALTVVHAESPAVLASAPEAAGRTFARYLASRPAAAETEAVAGLAALAASSGARLHVLHLSAAAALDDVATALDDGLPLTVETCPHYLTFLAEDVPDGATEFKCAPPIREAANRERLWDGLAAGLFAGVVTDHSPSTPALKAMDSGDFGAAWGGIASLQLGIAATWTAARERGFGLADLARWTSTGPADLIGLSASKGRIAVGADADLVVFDPEASFLVEPTALEHRHPVTPYAGRRLHGVVRATYLRGERIDTADGTRRPRRGNLLTR